MPLTTELIDAAKAELGISTHSTDLVALDGVWYERDRRTGKWSCYEDGTVVPENEWPYYTRALSRAHLAEARRLGVPAWALEELEAALGPMPLTTNATKWGAVKEFLTHLKSLPNA